MIDIGEDLVGAYLTRVVGCSLVQFNLRTGVNQGEIDVVGFRLSGGAVTELWLCEVSTHTRGLGGYRGDAAGKISSKIASVKSFADTQYPGIERHIEVWSPKVAPAMLAKLEATRAEHPDVELVANQDYAARVRELSLRARQESAYNDSPSFRLLQILTRLPSNPLD